MAQMRSEPSPSDSSRTRPGDRLDEAPLRLGDVKVIRRLVGHPGLLAELRLAAGSRGSFPADGVQPLDALRAAEYTVARGRLCGEQQPRDRGGGRTVVARLDFAGHFASIVRFPGRTRVVFADLLAREVEQFGFRCLENPLEPRRLGLDGAALVDLHAGSGR